VVMVLRSSRLVSPLSRRQTYYCVITQTFSPLHDNKTTGSHNPIRQPLNAPCFTNMELLMTAGNGSQMLGIVGDICFDDEAGNQSSLSPLKETALHSLKETAPPLLKRQHSPLLKRERPPLLKRQRSPLLKTQRPSLKETTLPSLKFPEHLREPEGDL